MDNVKYEELVNLIGRSVTVGLSENYNLWFFITEVGRTNETMYIKGYDDERMNRFIDTRSIVKISTNKR